MTPDFHVASPEVTCQVDPPAATLPGMRLGIGTVFWGRRIDDLDYALKLFAACGYQGVEFAQHHSQLFVREGKTARPIKLKELLDRLRFHNLELIGLVAGSLRQRREFLESHRSAYLYLDHWPKPKVDPGFHEEVRVCLDEGFTIALHPHWLMPIHRVRQVHEIIHALAARSNQVRLLLDVAHSLIAEDDPVKVIQDPDLFPLLHAVHLKDWRPDFGRWSHRYSHGFCSLGEGIVPLETVMQELHQRKFAGWVVYEKDHFSYRRDETVLSGARWMAKRGSSWGISTQINEAAVAAIEKQLEPNPFTTTVEFHRREYELGKELARTVAPNPDSSRFYEVVANKCRELCRALAVKVWSHNPSTEELCLVGISTERPEWRNHASILTRHFPDGRGLTLVGELAAHPHVCERDLLCPKVAARFADQDWLQQIRPHARWMTLVPVFNTTNKHQLRSLITIFTAEPLLTGGHQQISLQFSQDSLPDEQERRMSGELDRLGWVVAHWADYLTDQACSMHAGATNHLCSRHVGGVAEFVDLLREHLKRCFDCNSVTVFLKDEISGTVLKPAGKSDEELVWPDDNHSYRPNEGHTGIAFHSRDMVYDSRATTGKAREKRPEADAGRDEILFAPLVRLNGDCLGVVRLHNKRRNPGDSLATMFTDDDAARLDAVVQTTLPYLELLMLRERQEHGIARLIHELQTPLVTIRGAVDAMNHDLRKKNREATDVFRRDFPELILQWADLLGRLTRNWKVFTGGSGALPLQKRRTDLRKQVLIPVVHQIRGLLPRWQRLDFDYESFALPALWIDRDQFQQVFFNLLSNACKYSGKQAIVRVSIEADRSWTNSFSLWFSDWGIGIPEAERERIFDPGYRTRAAVMSDMSGQGIGLSVVRSIVMAHGGNIRVAGCKGPTTFEIQLPRELISP